MRVLITGGAGFIGSHLANRLDAEGHEVSVIDVLSPQIHGEDFEQSQLFRSLPKGVKFVRADVRDIEAWARLLKDQEAVVHLAAETGTGQSMYEIHRYADVNVGGTAKLLDWLANNKSEVRRVVVASSRSIYGEGKYLNTEGKVYYPGVRRVEDMKAGIFDPVDPTTGAILVPVATDEDAKIHPSSVYGITKQNQEQMVLTVCPNIGLEAVALRFQNVYGPGQSLKNPYTGILSIFSTIALNGNKIQIFEDGKESRDFVFIDDVVNSIILSLFKPDAKNMVFGIGSGVPTTVEEVATSLVREYGTNTPIEVTGAFRVGDIRHNFADLGLARARLDFEPQVDFQTGIRKFAEWVKKQKVEQDNFEKSVLEMRAKGLLK